MTFSRRRLLQLATGAAALPAFSRIASAQTYPSQPVRILVGFAAGGAFDIAARLIAEWLSARLGQPVIIENRTGGSTNIATEAVIRARPDGYTLLLGGATNAVNATLYDKLKFDFKRDTTPVAGVIRFPNVIVVNPSVPATSVSELIAHATANPGKVNFATPGIGTTQHLSGELLKMMARVDLVHVPYRGAAPALTDLLGGQVQMAVSPLPAVIEFVKAGKLRALAVTTAARADVLPDIPTVGESVPGYEASGWNGVVAPRNTPVEIVATLNREINAGLAAPHLTARFAALGGMVLPGSPGDFGKLIADETEKWAKVVRFASIRPE